MTRKRKERTKQETTFIANCPTPIIEAYNELVNYGVDAVSLVRLIRQHKRPSGRPAKTDEFARLKFSVDNYQQEHPEATDKDAIIAVLSKIPEYVKWSEDKQAEHVQRCQTALSRLRRPKSCNYKTPL